jgi:hypothetical protein
MSSSARRRWCPGLAPERPDSLRGPLYLSSSGAHGTPCRRCAASPVISNPRQPGKLDPPPRGDDAPT